jgi:hypothetical protein
VVLDAHPDGIIYRDLIPDYVKFVRTIYEGLNNSIPSLISLINLLHCRSHLITHTYTQSLLKIYALLKLYVLSFSTR